MFLLFKLPDRSVSGMLRYGLVVLYRLPFLAYDIDTFASLVSHNDEKFKLTRHITCEKFKLTRHDINMCMHMCMCIWRRYLARCELAAAAEMLATV